VPPERSPGSPVEWLARARADLAIARIPLPAEGRYEDLCLHAQQAAEKAIKAVYRAADWRFSYTHNLGQLLDGLERNGIAVPDGVRAAIVLTEYAHQTRYPGGSEPVTEAEHARAVALAAAVVEWASERIRGTA
jgi:HEPN domain-containing protein